MCVIVCIQRYAPYFVALDAMVDTMLSLSNSYLLTTRPSEKMGSCPHEAFFPPTQRLLSGHYSLAPRLLMRPLFPVHNVSSAAIIPLHPVSSAAIIPLHPVSSWGLYSLAPRLFMRPLFPCTPSPHEAIIPLIPQILIKHKYCIIPGYKLNKISNDSFVCVYRLRDCFVSPCLAPPIWYSLLWPASFVTHCPRLACLVMVCPCTTAG